ncbi:FAD:protein FMN transferase [Clostridium sp.]|uniref:FAD:protein FMN transferase n=1 Tax=Clostridium sp. TaxID=1506 RepID=UPI003F3918DD
MFKNSHKRITTLGLLIFFLSFITGCSKNNEPTSPISKSEVLMGTVVKVTLYDTDDTSILDAAFERVKELENILSINTTGTLIDKVNESAGISPVKVDEDTFSIIKKGLEYSNISNGLFDITIGPLVKLWSIGLPEAKVPTIDEISNTLPLINYKDVVLDEQDKTVFLKNPGMMIDLGGIAKGYTADELSKLLYDKGVESAIIDLGGNIFTHGKKISGDEWRVGIQNPFSDRGDIIGSILLSNKSVVTSGVYERYLEQDGVKYHHILSPVTGYPYENDLAGITIVSDTSIDGDALSTSVFAMGLTEGFKFIESMDGIEAIFITKENQIYITPGLESIFKLTNEDFKLSNF